MSGKGLETSNEGRVPDAGRLPPLESTLLDVSFLFIPATGPGRPPSFQAAAMFWVPCPELDRLAYLVEY